MKVKELIEQLLKMPPDALVQRFHSEGGIFREHYEDLREVNLVVYPVVHVELDFQ